MANGKLWNPDGANLTRLTEVFLVAVIGAAGAITSYTLQWLFGQNPLQATPLVRTSAGVYTVQLTEPYIGGVIWYSANTMQTVVNGATDGLTGILTTFATVKTTGVATLTMYNNATAATEVRNGATLLLSMGLKNNDIFP